MIWLLSIYLSVAVCVIVYAGAVIDYKIRLILWVLILAASWPLILIGWLACIGSDRCEAWLRRRNPNIAPLKEKIESETDD